MSGTGTAVVDFGAFPGTCEVTVNISGQSGILAGSSVDAWLVATPTGDHTALDHAWAKAFIAVSAGPPTAAVGFPVYFRVPFTLTGTFTFEWAWA